MNSEEKNKTEGSIVLAIVVFILIASGIPFALKNDEIVRSFGEIPIAVLGLVLAFLFARGAYKM